MSNMKRPAGPKFRCCASAVIAVVWLWGQPQSQAQNDAPPPPVTSRGENFSAKPPAALFASDCTGAGCHRGPQGLGRSMGIGGLAGFLREHYTNSRESAAALANYLQKLPAGQQPREARTPPGGRPAAGTATAPASGGPGWIDGILSPESPKPAPNEARTPRQTPGGRASRASTRPDDDPAATPPAATPPSGRPPSELTDPAKPAEASPKPGEAAPRAAPPAARAQRGRQQPTAAIAPPPPVPEAAPPPPPPPAAPPPPKEFDIFD